ncbi:sugar phosphate isomerase/epimerase family protein [Alistipes megaguti]|uniref:sugar phosphate isomerase/epimerase family protein n=1 Tax=Alistipes megaguti TaxID=2364787 RepID=UPI000EFA8A94|nr:sugar phosphate isomerase/epimerase family protein [Alistipes megaguti]
MKKLILLTWGLLAVAPIVLAKYPVGVSLGTVKTPNSENLARIKEAGVDYVEVTFNYFWRNAPENECYTRAYEVKKRIDEAGLKVWSCHLPFSRQLDISVLDPQQREENVLFMERMIRLAAIFDPQRLVLHPSSEPIADNERETRMQNSANSIGRLALAAKEIGVMLCIENLPRTCLGRNSDEILQLIANYPEVMVCFDSNHLLKEDHAHFFEQVGNRIGTIHASDYDRKDERHWLPGKGIIDWSDFLRKLKQSGYNGVFMYEIRSSEVDSIQQIVKAHHRIVLGKQK